MTITVLLADDQPLVRAGIAMLLENEPDVEVVAEAGDGRDAVRLAQTLRPDVVLMDVRMPVVDGVEATRQIAADGARSPDRPVRVLILTTYDDDAVYSALRAGACGFLLKHAAPEELLRAVRVIAGGGGWLDPSITPRMLQEFASRPEVPGVTSAALGSLTRRELEVLELVAHGLSNTDIATRFTISEATVKTHVGRLLMKLGLRDRAQAVAVAYRNGLVVPSG